MKRIAIAGEIFSANMGDRAIHGCMLYLTRLLCPAADTISIDISGREPHADENASLHLSQRIALLAAVPGFRLPIMMMKIIHHQMKGMQGQFQKLRRELETADMLIIGGGQLLMDDALNFPLKIFSLTRQAQALDLPYHFSACGVGKAWSRLGGRMLRRSLAPAQSITLRDHLSSELLATLAPGVERTVTFDPAIWAASVYPVQAADRSASRFGLGVLNPGDGNRYFPREKLFSKGDWTNMWVDLLERLADGDQPVEVFTTGDPADFLFAKELFDIAQRKGWGQVSLAPFPASPEALTASLNGYSVVAAARLHAAILANAYGIPSVGLVWDQKIRSYYEQSGRSDVCFNLMGLDPADVVNACNALRGKPFPASAIEDMKMRALEGLRIVLGVD